MTVADLIFGTGTPMNHMQNARDRSPLDCRRLWFRVRRNYLALDATTGES